MCPGEPNLEPGTVAALNAPGVECEPLGTVSDWREPPYVTG